MNALTPGDWRDWQAIPAACTCTWTDRYTGPALRGFIAHLPAGVWQYVQPGPGCAAHGARAEAGAR